MRELAPAPLKWLLLKHTDWQEERVRNADISYESCTCLDVEFPAICIALCVALIIPVSSD